MFCAACDAETELDPCSACGQSPLLDGRYRLQRVVGRGASGTTWEATGVDGARVALKEMVIARQQAEKSRELWLREVAVLQQLDHPAIPSFIEVFTVGQGRTQSLCLVQEFVEGQTLEAELGSHRYTEAEVLAVGQEIHGILTYLHGLSPPVIHRDLKPANVIRRPDGRLALIDFGCVRDSLKDVQIGGSTVAGTFGFMSPEQFRGDAVPATDYYGLGALMAALLTRRGPATMLRDDRTLGWEDHCDPSPEMRGVLQGLLTAEPEKRSTDLAVRAVTVAERPVGEAADLFEPVVDELPVLHASQPVTLQPEAASRVFTLMVLLLMLVCGALVTSVSLVVFAVVQATEEETPMVAAPPIVGTTGFLYNTSTQPLTVSGGVQPMELEPGAFRRLSPKSADSYEITSSGGFRHRSVQVEPHQMLQCDGSTCAITELSVVASSEVFIHRVAPVYPDVERSPGEICEAEVWIAPTGETAGSDVRGCSAPFAAAAAESLEQWIGTPGSGPARAQVRVRFQPKDP